jgi:hypothetical protein
MVFWHFLFYSGFWEAGITGKPGSVGVFMGLASRLNFLSETDLFGVHDQSGREWL